MAALHCACLDGRVAVGLRRLVYDDRVISHGLVLGVDWNGKFIGEYGEGLCRQR